MSQELPLDEIAAAACEAVIGKVDRTQVSRLLEVLEGAKDVNVVLAFLAKQTGRGQWNRRAATRLFKILRESRDIEEARAILGIFRWLYEAAGKDKDRGRKIAALQKLRLSDPAPKNFYYNYIYTCLK